jgi:hypothetical protein
VGTARALAACLPWRASLPPLPPALHVAGDGRLRRGLGPATRRGLLGGQAREPSTPRGRAISPWSPVGSGPETTSLVRGTTASGPRSRPRRGRPRTIPLHAMALFRAVPVLTTATSKRSPLRTGQMSRRPTCGCWRAAGAGPRRACSLSRPRPPSSSRRAPPRAPGAVWVTGPAWLLEAYPPQTLSLSVGAEHPLTYDIRSDLGAPVEPPGGPGPSATYAQLRLRDGTVVSISYYLAPPGRQRPRAAAT